MNSVAINMNEQVSLSKMHAYIEILMELPSNRRTMLPLDTQALNASPRQ